MSPITTKGPYTFTATEFKTGVKVYIAVWCPFCLTYDLIWSRGTFKDSAGNAIENDSEWQPLRGLCRKYLEKYLERGLIASNLLVGADFHNLQSSDPEVFEKIRSTMANFTIMPMSEDSIDPENPISATERIKIYSVLCTNDAVDTIAIDITGAIGCPETVGFPGTSDKWSFG